MLYEKSTAPYPAHFWEYVPGWGHESFAFREVAFAILSFALTTLIDSVVIIALPFLGLFVNLSAD